MHERVDPNETREWTYASFEAGDGTTVIYDQENRDAWIQSDEIVELGQ